MHKKAIDRITLETNTLKIGSLPEHSIVCSDAVKEFDKDSTNRHILFGECKRSYLIQGIMGVKAINLNLDFRPLVDLEGRLDYFISFKCIRNGRMIDKKIIKKSFLGIIKANVKNIHKFKISNKKLFNKVALEENDILIITVKQTRKTEKTIYFANMYITKEY